VPLTPSLAVPLVLVVKEGREEPPVAAFRKLLAEWLHAGKLFPRSQDADLDRVISRK